MPNAAVEHTPQVSSRPPRASGPEWPKAPARQHWATYRGFLLSSIGAVVGLGDLWRFPYLVTHYGGGAFLLAYLGCLLLAGVPMLTAELALGRRGAADPATGLLHLAWHEGRSPRWRWLGWLAAMSGLVLLALYGVVGGWAVAWFIPVMTGAVTAAPDYAIGSRLFLELMADPVRQIGALGCFLLLTGVVVAAGLRGVEAAMRRLVPALILLLVVLGIYAVLATGQAGAAVTLLLRPDFARLGTEGLVAAMSQAFFTLSVGCGVMLVYGSGLSSSVSLRRTATTIALVDIGVAMLAAFAIAPVLLAGHTDPAEGSVLAFVSLPAAYATLPFGGGVSAAFVVCLTLVALTSALALMQPLVECLVGSGLSRVRAAMTAGTAAWVLGVAAILSLGAQGGLRVEGSSLYQLLSRLSADLLLPLTWLGLALFAGWAISRRALRCELRTGRMEFGPWRALIRYLAPVLLIASLVISRL